MSINVSWVNRNERETSIEIYRSATLMDTMALPPPITTVPGNTNPPEYKDDVPKPGESFYYMTAIVDMATGAKVLSKQTLFTASQYRGPGPQTLIYGDENFGYYGPVSVSELASLSQLYSWIPEAEVGKYKWLKFVRNNKIIYCTDRPVSSNIGNKVVNGTERFRSGIPVNKRPALHPAGLYNDNILTNNNFKFHIRVAYILPDSWTSDTEPAPIGGVIDSSQSELSDLLTAMSPVSDIDYGRLPILPITHPALPYGYPIVGPEGWTKNSNAVYLCFSFRGNTTSQSNMTSVFYANGLKTLRGYTNTSGSFFCLPVLELIES